MINRFYSATTNAVYQYLLEHIISGELKPGDKIPETTIAQSLHVSRTPVRDALRELAVTNVVTLYPNKYSEITIFDKDRMREVGITKINLDRLAIRLAIYYGSRAEYEGLKVFAETCYRKGLENDYSGRVNADSDFHLELCHITKNRTLIQIERILLIQLEYLQIANYLNAEDPEAQYKMHLRIIEALKNGDVQAGMEAITRPSLSFYNVEGIPSSLFDDGAAALLS